MQTTFKTRILYRNKRLAYASPPYRRTDAICTISKYFARQKGGDLTQSYDKSPYTNRNVIRAKWQHKQHDQKSSIKQQLRTDLGRSVGVTTATKLVWFTGQKRVKQELLVVRKCSRALNFNYLVSITAGGLVSPRGHMKPSQRSTSVHS